MKSAADKWMEQVRAWAASHPQRDYVDDSRESIYGEGRDDEGGTVTSSRRERYARLIALIESWLADESGYDEAVWLRLKARIEESRTSHRKRFSDDDHTYPRWFRVYVKWAIVVAAIILIWKLWQV